ncbi:hypothetical protein [Siphonobacter sp.]|uniref:hypothetical protein n=1 Tax=Siphonobacter sp. TaxID=1869184 RepID=UPI003B3B6361
MKRFLFLACLVSACTSGPKENTHQPAFDTLDFSYAYAWSPRKSYSIKIAKNREAWLATRLRGKWEYFHGVISPEHLGSLQNNIQRLIAQSPQNTYQTHLTDQNSFQLILNSPTDTRKSIKVYGTSIPTLDSLSFSIDNIRALTAFYPLKHPVNFDSQKGVVLPLLFLKAEDYLPPY